MIAGFESTQIKIIGRIKLQYTQMNSTVRLILIYLIITTTWVISFVLQPFKLSLSTIFYPAVGEEKRIFDEKKGLDTSEIKVIYYNKTTIYFDRYWKNFFSLLDINGYFFGGHPREDVSDKVFRFKIFWILVIPFVIGLWKLRISWVWLPVLFILSFLKNPDGLDLILIIPIGLIIDNGFNNLSRLWQNWKK